jgi:small subunit ribosomal protein S4
MKKARKKYEKPVRKWDKARIEKEKELLKKFGLRRKKEIWRVEALLRKFRRLARKLLATPNKEMEKILIKKLVSLGILKENSNINDVLKLSVEDILKRRLQTIVAEKGLANSIKQARQFITHGKVKIGGRKITYPSYLVRAEEEDKIQVENIQKK